MLLKDLRYAVRQLLKTPGFTLTALAASVIPARRAASIEPMQALRSE